MRFPDSSIFNGLPPSKMAMRPCIAEAVAFYNTLPGERGRPIPKQVGCGEARTASKGRGYYSMRFAGLPQPAKFSAYAVSGSQLIMVVCHASSRTVLIGCAVDGWKVVPHRRILLSASLPSQHKQPQCMRRYGHPWPLAACDRQGWRKCWQCRSVPVHSISFGASLPHPCSRDVPTSL